LEAGIKEVHTSPAVNNPLHPPTQDESNSTTPAFTAEQKKQTVALNDCQPVALQSAYEEDTGVDDTFIYLLDKVYSHLDTTGSTVRIMFFDFSSAFNTMQPSIS
ncbi:hypothetical protein P4O66_011924, partial [Electrophorus voltai]